MKRVLLIFSLLIIFSCALFIPGLSDYNSAKKQFRVAARSKDKKIKKAANNWLKYTENEEIRVKNLALRRDFIQNS